MVMIVKKTEKKCPGFISVTQVTSVTAGASDGFWMIRVTCP
jgi:hypothetical protein